MAVIYGTPNSEVLQNSVSNTLDTIIGYGGNDSIYGNGAPAPGDILYGNEGNDYIVIGTYTAGGSVFAGMNNDSVVGSDYPDLIYGDAGSDSILGNAGADNLIGTNTTNDPFNDSGDTIRGGTGNDYISGNVGNDALYGGDGNDALYGGKDNDNLFGDNGNDSLFGDLNDDRLFGGAGSDSLQGGDGNDRINGETNSDHLWGGIGFDTFTVRAFDNAGDIDTIWDFEGTFSTADTDKLVLQNVNNVQGTASGADLLVQGANPANGAVQTFLRIKNKGAYQSAFNAMYGGQNYARLASFDSLDAEALQAQSDRPPESETGLTEEQLIALLPPGTPNPFDITVSGLFERAQEALYRRPGDESSYQDGAIDIVPIFRNAIQALENGLPLPEEGRGVIWSTPESIDLASLKSALQDIEDSRRDSSAIYQENFMSQLPPGSRNPFNMTVEEVFAMGREALSPREGVVDLVPIMERAIEALKNGQPLPEEGRGTIWSTPESIDLPSLESALSDILDPREGLGVVVPESEIDPLTQGGTETFDASADGGLLSDRNALSRMDVSSPVAEVSDNDPFRTFLLFGRDRNDDIAAIAAANDFNLM
jgi:RTX calcium-binding nonapeptide repeat (4 copies)